MQLPIKYEELGEEAKELFALILDRHCEFAQEFSSHLVSLMNPLDHSLFVRGINPEMVREAVWACFEGDKAADMVLDVLEDGPSKIFSGALVASLWHVLDVQFVKYLETGTLPKWLKSQ